MAQFRLILGGGASGKSRYAEGLVMAMPQPRAYIATAQAWDDEMRAKIAQHQQQRGPDWLTIEAPQELPKALRDLPSDHVVLIDCATLWLSNLMLDNKDLLAAQTDLLAALAERQEAVVVVSNEVGQGIVPEHALGRQFRNAQGRLNQALAAQADQVEFVIAGLPMTLKAPDQ